jgi:hypothetical protein
MREIIAIVDKDESKKTGRTEGIGVFQPPLATITRSGIGIDITDPKSSRAIENTPSLFRGVTNALSAGDITISEKAQSKQIGTKGSNSESMAPPATYIPRFGTATSKTTGNSTINTHTALQEIKARESQHKWERANGFNIDLRDVDAEFDSVSKKVLPSLSADEVKDLEDKFSNIRASLEQLKKTTRTSLPNYDPRLRTKTYEQIIKARLANVALRTKEIVQKVKMEKRGRYELKA